MNNAKQYLSSFLERLNASGNAALHRFEIFKSNLSNNSSEWKAEN